MCLFYWSEQECLNFGWHGWFVFDELYTCMKGEQYIYNYYYCYFAFNRSEVYSSPSAPLAWCWRGEKHNIPKRVREKLD